jgi:hypothetical protein
MGAHSQQWVGPPEAASAPALVSLSLVRHFFAVMSAGTHAVAVGLRSCNYVTAGGNFHHYGTEEHVECIADTVLAGQSLQLKGTGTKYSNFAWAPASAASFGTLNVNQTIGAAATPVPSPPPPVAADPSPPPPVVADPSPPPPVATAPSAACSDAFINEVIAQIEYHLVP